ncbi:MAG: hypothetical protein HRT77_07150 [Halioglobus sp.]|nr:hypothetical protein [Halioglobus sp.]
MSTDPERQHREHPPSLGRQVQANLLSVISLVVALAALGYNTYRNELTEHNRNVRSAGFIILQELSQLQLIADHAYYDRNVARGNPIDGWGRVLYMQDMSQLVSPEVVALTENLIEVWGNNWSALEEQEVANERITAAIVALRHRVRVTITSLD